MAPTLPVALLPRMAGRTTRLAARTAFDVATLTAETWALGPVESRRDAIVRRWAAAMLRALGVTVIAAPALSSGLWTEAFLPRGMEDGSTGRVVVSNHRSMVDILVMLAAFGGHLLSRDDLARWPVLGRLAPYAGTLYVDRSDKASGSAALRAMVSRLRLGRSLTIFPEGTTYPDDEVRDFHPGAFAAALRTGAPVLPVGLAYDGDHATFFQEPFLAHATRLLEAPETRVALAVGEPLDTRGASLREVQEEAHRAVQALVHTARATLLGLA